jgi:FdhD protein
VTIRELPVSKTLAGVNMRLTAGGVRELHWHTAGEWSLMLYGTARITAIDADGKSFVADVKKNDLWFFPSGIPHSIQGLNPDGCEFMLVFEDGEFSESETLLLSDAMAHLPLEIRIGQKTVATTMRTPGHDEELAAGFLVSEGILRRRDQIGGFSRPADARNRENIIALQLADGVKVKIASAKRFGTISSSCGICGKESIAAIRQNFPPIVSAKDVRIDIATLLSLHPLLRKLQSEFARTGGIHAAGIFDPNGQPRVVREDIGRHNAVDKAIGRASLDGQLPLHRHVLLVSGRASFEIMQKALAAGIPIVASVSAPSTLAMEFARQSTQTLIGFLRPPLVQRLFAH